MLKWSTYSWNDKKMSRKSKLKTKKSLKHQIQLIMIATMTLIALIVYICQYIRNVNDANINNSNNNHISRNLLSSRDKSVFDGYPHDAFTIKERDDGAWVMHFLGMCYTFVAIALVCDEFFVPAIEVIVDTLEMSPDTAGATWMAAGGSAPELFTSFIGTFASRSNVGFGTIVGSAVFNVLFVIGCCAIFTPGHLPLTWWPFARDCLYYMFSLVILALFFGIISPDIIYWWEAALLLCLYIGYVSMMKNNRRLQSFFYRKFISNNEKGRLSSQVKQAGDLTQAQTESQNDDSNNGDINENKTGNTNENENVNNKQEMEMNEIMETEEYFGDTPHALKFHASLFDFLTKDQRVEDIIKVHIVARMKGETKETFNKIDKNGDGTIDVDELALIFGELGQAITNEDVTQCFDVIDVDKNGEISFSEFEDWYLQSQLAITSEIRDIFNKFDENGDKHIDCDELRTLLDAMHFGDAEVMISDSDIESAMNELGKKMDDKISEEEFIAWYQQTQYFENKKLQRKQTLNMMEGSDEDEGIDLSFPSGWGPRIMYVVTAPIMYSLYYTLPDVQKEKNASKWPGTFIGSMLWLGAYSYLMVWWATVVGFAWGIPDEVMGLTFLAAGTSVPDLLSSIIVAKMGEADMAVSSSIGSNIFDILIGLPLPWLLFSLTIGDGRIHVKAGTLFYSVIILIAMLMAVLFTIKLNGWKLTHRLGYTMFVLWIMFVVQDVVRQLVL